MKSAFSTLALSKTESDSTALARIAPDKSARVKSTLWNVNLMVKC